MKWRFTIIFPDSTTEEIDEPVGWDAIEWSARRNMKHHGMFFSISTDSFEFVGDAFTILSNAYDTYGANADLTFLVEYDCDYSGSYTEYYRGKFDFNTYQRECGDYCCVKIAISPDSCVDIFLSRNDQDINLNTAVDLDGNAITPLTEYAVRFNGQELQMLNSSNNQNNDTWIGSQVSDNGAAPFIKYFYIPLYLPNTVINEFGEFNIPNAAPTIVMKNNGSSIITDDNAVNWLTYGIDLQIFRPITDPSLIINNINVDWKARGFFKVLTNFDGQVRDLVLFSYRKNWSADNDYYDLGSVSVAVNTPITANQEVTIQFDYGNIDTISMPTPDTSGLYHFIYVTVENYDYINPATIDMKIEYDGGIDENYYKIFADSVAPPVNVGCYNLQDVMGFLPSAYTGTNCFEVVHNAAKLNFFHITNGLKIRRVTEPSTPNIFTNWQFMFNNIQKIFNIGWGFKSYDAQLMIGELSDFYDSSDTILDLGAIDKVMFTHARDLTYAGATIGYNKWEGEEVNGLDAVNTKREYARNIDSNNNKLELMCDIIADGYTIEITRRRSQDNNGTEDWRFDNDIFIVNITYSEEYDQIMTYNGIDSGAANIYSPSTRYNYKITPARMMMEWMKSFVAANPDYTLDQLQFRSGTGNYIARGLMSNQYTLEIQSTIENETLAYDDFYSQDYITPLWKPVYADFEAPFSMFDMQKIREFPYNLIAFSCAGIQYEGYLIECNHKPNDGMASLKLLLKYVLPE